MQYKVICICSAKPRLNKTHCISFQIENTETHLKKSVLVVSDPFRKISTFYDDIDSRVVSKFHANRPLKNGISEALYPRTKKFVLLFLAALDRGCSKFPGNVPFEPRHCVKFRRVGNFVKGVHPRPLALNFIHQDTPR